MASKKAKSFPKNSLKPDVAANIDAKLDDLLSAIRDEPDVAEMDSAGALARYVGTKSDDLVTEEVDERILNLIGLDDTIGIDYATYASLLREAAAKARVTNTKLTTEEAELVTNEFRRVKNKVGRFKIQRKKITAQAVAPTAASRIGPAPQDVLSAGVSPEIVKSVESIDLKLDALLNDIRAGFKLEQESEKKKARLAERQRRKLREKARESGRKSVLSSVAEKIVAPFKNIFDRILKFLKLTFLSFAFDKLIKWFGDPANKKKIETLTKFLQDFWPVIGAAAVAFLTPFGGFVKNTLKLLRFFGRQLIKFMAKNPAAAAALVAGVSLTSILGVIDAEKKKFDEEEKRRNQKPIEVPGASGGGLFDVYDGGKVTTRTGERVIGGGVDTQLAALRPGEMVFSKEAVDYWGADKLLNMNKRGGGTNIPKKKRVRSATIPAMQGGGIVGGIERALSVFPGSGRVMQPQANYDNYPGYGRKTDGGGYAGKSQFKFLGMPVPGTQRTQRFSETDVNRYNAMGGSRLIERMKSYYPGATLHKTIVNPSFNIRGGNSTSQTLNNKEGSIGAQFYNNLNIIQKAIKAKEDTMRELGVEPDGYDTIFQRSPALQKYMKPQSRVPTLDSPTVSTRTQVIMLPQQHKPLPKSVMTTKDGTDIPDFRIVATGNEDRDFMLASLGIDDIVG
tara:strand:+ start:685 stop:2718 length:2034 start_codon:yes stop_codon:yes gene_type:complete